METLAELRTRYRAEEESLLRAALQATDWYVKRAATKLKVSYSTFQCALRRHAGLYAEYKRHRPGMGRPRLRGKKKGL
jgi:transcriptional regulator of acetoin/glycerol metabolism